MSKVNVDEIQVGDMVFNRLSQRSGKVTRFCEKFFRRVYWIPEGESKETFSPLSNLELLKPEEENKMDELKVYTGKETLQALLEGKTLSWATDQFKLDEEFLYEKNDSNKWTRSYRSLAHFTNNKFTEVVTPQVGDWVKVTCKNDGFSKVYTAEVKRIDNEGIWGEWNQPFGDIISPILLNEYSDWEILSPEQISEYKREQAFVKVGRKLNEFKHGDIVYIDALAVVATVITKNSGMEEINLHGINEACKGYTARAHQLTPISFIEQQVDLS